MLRKSLPSIVCFGVLLLLVFRNSPYVKIFDSVLWPVRFGILAGFSILLLWSRRRHRRDAASHKCRLARCGRPFPFFRGALVPRRCEAVKVNNTPVLGAGSYPGSVKRSEPPVFFTLRRIHWERSRQGPTKFPRMGTIVRRRQAVFAARQSGLFLVFQVPLTRHAGSWVQ